MPLIQRIKDSGKKNGGGYFKINPLYIMDSMKYNVEEDLSSKAWLSSRPEGGIPLRRKGCA